MKNITDPLAPVCECLIYKLKIVPNRVTEQYKVVSYKHFPSISLFGGLYETSDCSMFGTYNVDHERKYVPYSSKKAEQIVGISDTWAGEFTVCVIHLKNKRKVKRKNYFGEISMYNSPLCIEYNSKKSPVSNYIVREMREMLASLKFRKDFSMERAHDWGPLSRMIKGFAQVKTGKVKADDYYWDDDHGNGHWVRCDVSFSPIRPGQKIERRSILFVDERSKPHKKRSYSYFNEFVIRKR